MSRRWISTTVRYSARAGRCDLARRRADVRVRETATIRAGDVARVRSSTPVGIVGTPAFRIERRRLAMNPMLGNSDPPCSPFLRQIKRQELAGDHA
jgi:hypothetical protein